MILVLDCLSDTYHSLLDVTVINTTLSSSLASTDPIYQQFAGHFSKYYYKLFQITVRNSSIYTCSIKSRIKTIGYMYKNIFDVSSPSSHLLTEDRITNSNQQYPFQKYLEAGSTYYLLVTTRLPRKFGAFSITVSGPTLAMVELVQCKSNFS